MPDDYPTTYETALAVVATAMKKARLRIHVLVINSFVGGVIFSTGGMLQVLIESSLLRQLENDSGWVRIAVSMFSFSIGLFFVVVLGLDLFNSNILYFSTAFCRGAVSIIDVFISWFVSFSFNLVGIIFVSFVICKFSRISSEPNFITASHEIVVAKNSLSFIETLIRGLAGNFYVCLGIYLQLMVRPLHVKFIVLTLPVYAFSCIGFTHVVTDMFLVIIGSINHAPVPLGTLVWKSLLPASLGNILGGSIFGIIIVWFLHIYVVEQDQKMLNLPAFELKDEQPQQNMDSRVVAQIPRKEIEEEEELESFEEKFGSEPQPYQLSNMSANDLRRLSSRLSRNTILRRALKSPKNVFPVYGMANPSERDRLIAGFRKSSQDLSLVHENEGEAEFIADALKRVVSRRPTKKKFDDPENKMTSQSTSRSFLREPHFDQSRNRSSTISSGGRDPNANLSISAPDVGCNVSSVDSEHVSIQNYKVLAYEQDSGSTN